jgi:hypothetical protein
MSGEPSSPGVSAANGRAADAPADPGMVSPADASAVGSSAAGTNATDPQLRLQAIFSVHGDDEQAFATATELIDRLSVLANLPECSCDVDISLQRAPSPGQGRG